MGAIDLTAILWREREALQAVLERQWELAETLRAVDRGAAHAGELDAAGISRALDALEDVVARLRPVILMRDVEIAAVAEEWRVAAGLTLAELPHFAPAGPWGDIFADHLRALRDAARHSEANGRQIERLLAARGAFRAPRLPVSPADYEGPLAD